MFVNRNFSISFIILVKLLVEVFSYPALNYGWPPCANLTFTPNGILDVSTTLYDCIARIPSAEIPPSYYDVTGEGYHPINISVQFAINNLINVDDLQSQVTLDYYFRCTWIDPRIYIPDMWEYINPEAHIDGLVITPFIENANTPLNVWLPDFYFIDAADQEVIVETVKLRPNGTLYWSRHFVVTLSQPTMNFQDFPLDSQNFSIRFQSYAYDSHILQIDFVNPGVVLLTDPQNNDQDNIAMNVLWTYDSWTAYSENSFQPIVYNPTRHFYVGYVNIKFTRAADGVIYRLGLPVTICLIVVGFAFWSTVEKRIEVTLQMLLVTAALYLVIGQIIPFVGYLTTMDIFVTTVFLCLAGTVGINFYSLLLELKEDIRPMNLFYRTFLVTFLRAIWIPISLIIYISFFDIETIYMYAILGTISALMGAYAINQIDKIMESFEYSIRNLRKKAEFITLQQTGKMKIKGDSAFGETFIRQLSMSRFEKRILKFFRSYYQTPAKRDLQQKYLTKFSTLLREEAEQQDAEDEKLFGEKKEGDGSYLEDTNLRREGEIVSNDREAPLFSIKRKTNFTNIESSLPTSVSNGNKSFIVKTDIESTGAPVDNPLMLFRVSDAIVDSDDEDEHPRRQPSFSQGVEMKTIASTQNQL